MKHTLTTRVLAVLLVLAVAMVMPVISLPMPVAIRISIVVIGMQNTRRITQVEPRLAVAQARVLRRNQTLSWGKKNLLSM
jgi:hypothetical protein